MAISWVKSLGCVSSSSLDDVLCRRLTFISPSQPRMRKRKAAAPPPPPPPPTVAAPPSRFATLTELLEGDSSRRVVEIIFSTSWSQTASPPPATAPGEIERLFKVCHPPLAVAGFEEYREAVRSRAGQRDPRCAADGNEMMRFRSLSLAGAGEDGAAAGEDGAAAGEDGAAAGEDGAAAGGGIRTFAGAGRAHESAIGGGRGRRRAMAVCRVIAGRVRSSVREPGEFESFSPGNGELLVFDPRAVLPCFLIIYRA